jgi:tetratricopeptide (TPR) repeat protein
MHRIFEQLGRHRLVLESLSWESLNASRYSTDEHALETRQRCLDLRHQGQAESVYYWNLFEMGDIHRIFGNAPKALEYYEQAHQNFERINLVLGLGYYQRALGDLAIQAGDFTRAREQYLAYQAYAGQDNHFWSMAHGSVKLAWVNAHLGELEAARQYNSDCLCQMGETVHDSLELMALLVEARCLAEEGQLDSAIALAAFAVENPVTWKETGDLAKAMLADLAEKLDEETYRAAYRHLQGQDVHQLIAG